MSSSEVSVAKSATQVEVLFEKSLSSEDPPPEEWSSLEFSETKVEGKALLAAQGLYEPGSGEVCAKYISLSDSFVLRHPYYKFPGILDPGIRQALFNSIPTIIFPDDGQELYLDLCKKNNEPVVRGFYKQLLEDMIDLKYYGVSSIGLRPMMSALKLNKYVKVLDLSENCINQDACYHLGEMLTHNYTLTDLNLCGCKIGIGGARRFLNFLPLNRSLKVLNLAKNQLYDEGVIYFANAVFKGADIINVNLSCNNITEKSIVVLTEAFETHNKFTHLNLSWNSIRSPNAIFNLCTKLAENLEFQELDLSWNSMMGARVGKGLKVLLDHKNIRKVILRNNRLEGDAITAIAANLIKAPKLEILDLSNNPITIRDAKKLLLPLKQKEAKIKNLLLENVIVSEEFVETMTSILKLKFRANTKITHGYVQKEFTSVGRDLRDIAMCRADFLGKSSKKNPQDIAVIVLELYKEVKIIDSKEFERYCKKKGLVLNDDLVTLISQLFSGGKTDKGGKLISLEAIVEFIKRKWPDRKAPPTPPEPVELPPAPATKGKKKK